MSNFNSIEGDLDRVFLKEHELYDKYFGTQLWACGYNLYGMLGDNSIVTKSSPITVSGGGTNWKQIGISTATALTKAAIKTDGTLWTWGANSSGQLGNNSTINRSSPVTVSGGGTNWLSVALGSEHTIALKTDGTLWTWGANYYGGLGNNSTVSRSSPATVSGGGTNWKRISADRHSAAIKTDGTLWIWGRNNKGELGNESTINTSSPGTISGGGTNWQQISCGYQFTAAIKTDGTLWTWGDNNYNKLGQGINGGPSRSSPVTIAGGGTNWKQISCGYQSAVAIKTDSSLWTWGSNQYGALGNNVTNLNSSPNTVSGGGNNWKQVASGRYCMGAIKTDGTLWTWGLNDKGQLGINSTSNKSSPILISNETNWKIFSAAAYSFYAIKM
jgi:alpha-tubulin suppressor-like RCC1 family protein